MTDAAFCPITEEQQREYDRAIEQLKRDRQRAIDHCATKTRSIEERIERRAQAFTDKWGREDGDARRIYARAQFEREQLAYSREYFADKNEITELAAEVANIDRRFSNPMNRPEKPRSRFEYTPVKVSRTADDAQVAKVRAEIEALKATRDATIQAISELEPVVAAQPARVAELELQEKHGIATAAEIREARRKLEAAEQKLAGYRTQLAASSAQLPELEQREHALYQEAAARVRAEVRQHIDRTTCELADLLIPALAAYFKLEDLVEHPLVVGEYSCPDMSSARRFLDRALDAGWKPKEHKK